MGLNGIERGVGDRANLFLGAFNDDEEEAATQCSILEELHSIHDESQSDPTDLPGNEGPMTTIHADQGPRPLPSPVITDGTTNDIKKIPAAEFAEIPVAFDESENPDHSTLIAAAEEVGAQDLILKAADVSDEHALLFDGLEDDTFDNIELSPPKQRTRSFSHKSALSSQLSPSAPALTLFAATHVKEEPDMFGQADSNDLFDPFHEPSTPLSQVASFLNPQFVGFKTGRGQSVQLSEKALDIAKRLFDDLDQDDALPFASQLAKPVFVPPLKTVPSRPLPTTPSLGAPSPSRSPLREIPPRQTPIPTPIAIADTSPPEKPLPPINTATAMSQRPPAPALPGPAFSSPAPRMRPPHAVPAFSPLRSNSVLPVGSSARFSTPQSTSRVALGTTPRPDKASTGKKRPLPKFVTPFKNGKRPKAEEQSDLQSPLGRIAPAALKVQTSSFLKGGRLPQATDSVFSLKRLSERTKLAELGRPEALSSLQMIAQGAPDEIVVILQDSAKASWYAFDTPDGQLLRQEQALEEIQRRGCNDVTLSWVKNHWTMILWKLAAFARLDPKQAVTRWSWDEVIRQLLYRYERETNLAHRSCIRRIQERDSSPGRAMVLFVSQIHEEEEEVEVKTGGTVVQKSIVVDLSDGWYRIQAQLDGVLAQACIRGRIKVGSKLSIMGARLENNGEGNEVMSAYHTSRIMLSANAVSLARWDAKLGFAPSSFVASLRSLTPEGGTIALMDVVILKVFPLAYIDAERGQNSAPRGVAEEEEAKEAWLRRREDAQQRMELQMESQNRRLEDLVECLASLSGDSLLPVLPEDTTGRMEAEASRIFELVCDHLNPPAAVSELVVQRGLTALVPWLQSMAKRAFATQAETGWTRMHAEMDRLCPPRKVREFRVVRFRDARLPPPPSTNGAANNAWEQGGAVRGVKNPHARTVQLTVWDAAQLGDSLREGQRFLVSNLVPTSKSAWRKADEPADIFLSTRRDTKWRPTEA